MVLDVEGARDLGREVTSRMEVVDLGSIEFRPVGIVLGEVEPVVCLATGMRDPATERDVGRICSGVSG